jgi:hypothetical protein
MTMHWEVKIWLGDQTDWFLESVVSADDEASAIARGRMAVLEGWPEMTRHIQYAPARARCLGPATYSATVSSPVFRSPRPPRAADRIPESQTPVSRK